MDRATASEAVGPAFESRRAYQPLVAHQHVLVRLRSREMMDPRRLDQLERASRLRVNVSVLFGIGDEAPTVVELAQVKRTVLATSARVHVQVLSWTDVGRYVTFPVLHGAQGDATETLLADAVDRALDRFETHAAG